MECQEPRFDKETRDVEFRPRTHRCHPPPSRDSGSFAWKIGVPVGIPSGGRMRSGCLRRAEIFQDLCST